MKPIINFTNLTLMQGEWEQDDWHTFSDLRAMVLLAHSLERNKKGQLACLEKVLLAHSLDQVDEGEWEFHNSPSNAHQPLAHDITYFQVYLEFLLCCIVELFL